MMKNKLMITILLLVLVTLSCMADEVSGLPIHVKKIDKDVIRLWAGDHFSATVVTAIATEKGIVVIDTTQSPRIDAAFREIIAREFGRSDFRYLINTHGDMDHVSGNAVYSDCDIISQERVLARMKIYQKYKSNFLESLKEITKNSEALTLDNSLTPAEKALTSEQHIINVLTEEQFSPSSKWGLPTITFRGKLIIDCGDTTLELYQSGGIHTVEDIFIFLPEKGYLFTGDMMADKWITPSPRGCLERFAVRDGIKEDYPILLKNWKALIEKKDKISQLFLGHSNAEISLEGFQNRFDYFSTIYSEVQDLVAKDGDKKKFLASYLLKVKFPHLVGSPGFSEESNSMSISHLYAVLSGKPQLSDELVRLLRAGKYTEEFARARTEVLEGKYIYAENKLNELAYYLLNSLKQTENAMSLFQLNVELHPDSWNAYDSIAEANLILGNKTKALEYYRKSVELNSTNPAVAGIIAGLEKEIR